MLSIYEIWPPQASPSVAKFHKIPPMMCIYNIHNACKKTLPPMQLLKKQVTTLS